jgi:hypothetical protein
VPALQRRGPTLTAARGRVDTKVMKQPHAHSEKKSYWCLPKSARVARDSRISAAKLRLSAIASAV